MTQPGAGASEDGAGGPPAGARETDAGGKSRGCLFWGCSTICLILAIAAICMGWVLWSIYSEVNQFAADEPVPVPVYEPRSGQVREVTGRVEQFAEQVERGDASRVELRAEDLNTLVAAQGGDVAKGIYVQKIEESQLSLDLSVSLDDVPGFEGKYFNGTAVLKIGEENGEWHPKPVSITTKKGQKVSERTAEIFSRLLVVAIEQAMAKAGEEGEAARRILGEGGGVRIDGDRIVLEARPTAVED